MHWLYAIASNQDIKGALRIVLFKPSISLHKCFLRGVLRISVISQQPIAEVVDRLLVLLDDLCECIVIAVYGCSYQSYIVVTRQWQPFSVYSYVRSDWWKVACFCGAQPCEQARSHAIQHTGGFD